MKISPTKRLAIIAVFTALIAIFMPIPFCFLLPIVLASIWFDIWTSMSLSLVMGIISYLFSFMGGNPLSIAFIMYPYIAIVPRLLIGPAVWGMHTLLSKMTKKSENMFLKFHLPAAISGLTGALVNTGGVLGMFALCAGNAVLGDTAMTILLATWAISGAIEAVVITMLTPIVDAAGRKVLVRTNLRSGR